MTQLKIKASSGGAMLDDCYFEVGPTAIAFYDKNPTAPGPLNNNVKLNVPFTFALKDDPGTVWRIKATSIVPKRIDGQWSYTSPRTAEEDGAGSGTFQAQAGGTVKEPAEHVAAKGKAAV